MRINCHVCSGSGSTKTWINCYICNGTGRRMSFVSTGPTLVPCSCSGGGFSREIICNFCEGIGYYETGHKTSADVETSNERIIEIYDTSVERTVGTRFSGLTYLLICLVVMVPLGLISLCIWLAVYISQKHNDNLFSSMLNE